MYTEINDDFKLPDVGYMAYRIVSPPFINTGPLLRIYDIWRILMTRLYVGGTHE